MYGKYIWFEDEEASAKQYPTYYWYPVVESGSVREQLTDMVFFRKALKATGRLPLGYGLQLMEDRHA